MAYLRVQEKVGKLRYVPTNHYTLRLTYGYLNTAEDFKYYNGPLLQPIRKPSRGQSSTVLTLNDLYSKVVLRYLEKAGMRKSKNLDPYAFRATAVTSELRHGADLENVQVWLGHSRIQTTRIYDHRCLDSHEPRTIYINND